MNFFVVSILYVNLCLRLTFFVQAVVVRVEDKNYVVYLRSGFITSYDSHSPPRKLQTKVFVRLFTFRKRPNDVI